MPRPYVITLIGPNGEKIDQQRELGDDVTRPEVQQYYDQLGLRLYDIQIGQPLLAGPGGALNPPAQVRRAGTALAESVQGQPTSTLGSLLPSIAMTGLGALFPQSRLAPPAIRAFAAARPFAARTHGAILGALAGAPMGDVIQRAQGVPGPSLWERATREVPSAILASVGPEIARPVARRAVSPYGAGVGAPGPSAAIPGMGAREAIQEAESVGMKASAVGVNPLKSLGQAETPETVRTLGARQSQDALRFIRAQQASTNAARAGMNPNLQSTKTLVRRINWLDDQVARLSNNPSGTLDLPTWSNNWRQLGEAGRRRLYPNNDERALMDKFARVAGRSPEAGKIARGELLGQQQRWQQIAAVIRGAIGGGVAHTFGMGPAVSGGVFLGTTAAMTLRPHIVSWFMRRPWGVKWLTGALLASEKGQLVGDVADASSRVLARYLMRDAQAGDPIPLETEGVPPEPPRTPTP